MKNKKYISSKGSFWDLEMNKLMKLRLCYVTSRSWMKNRKINFQNLLIKEINQKN